MACSADAPVPPPPVEAGGEHGLPFLPDLVAVERDLAVPGAASDPAALEGALARIDAVVAERPDYTYAWLLRAWVQERRGERGERDASLAHVPRDRRPAWSWLFERPESEVVALLVYHAGHACQTAHVVATGRLEPDPTCPPFDPARRPPRYATFEQVVSLGHSADRLARWGAPGTTEADLAAMVGITPGRRVADVGAGDGYFTLPFARAVGPEGAVIAVEIEPDFLDFIAHSARELGLDNVRTHLGRPDGVGLEPGSVDLVFLCEVMKEVAPDRRAADPAQVAAKVTPFVQSLHDALAPGGTAVVVEHAVSDDAVEGLGRRDLDRLMASGGLGEPAVIDRFLPEQVVLVYPRP